VKVWSEYHLTRNRVAPTSQILAAGQHSSEMLGVDMQEW